MSTALGIEMKTTALPMVEDKDGQRVADALSNVLADTFVLYLKTHNFHWNVTGPMFHTLHQMFEEQYNELWLAVDANVCARSASSLLDLMESLTGLHICRSRRSQGTPAK